MATTITRTRRDAGTAGTHAPKAPPSPAPLTAPRRSAPLAVAGVACMLLGGLAAAAVYLRLDQRVPALVVTRTVEAGQVIADADLAVVEVGAAGIAHVPAADRGAVVGRTAAVAIPQGSLLSPAAVGDPTGLSAGEAVVGLALKQGQAPAQLRAGDRVAVVDTEALSGTDTQSRRPTTITEAATVMTVSRGEANVAQTVSVRLPRGVADAVVSAGAAGRASLVLLPPAP